MVKTEPVNPPVSPLRAFGLKEQRFADGLERSLHIVWAAALLTKCFLPKGQTLRISGQVIPLDKIMNVASYIRFAKFAHDGIHDIVLPALNPAGKDEQINGLVATLDISVLLMFLDCYGHLGVSLGKNREFVVKTFEAAYLGLLIPTGWNALRNIKAREGSDVKHASDVLDFAWCITSLFIAGETRLHGGLAAATGTAGLAVLIWHPHT